MKKALIFTLLLICTVSFSQQKSVNDFKYVIVPSQFNWLSSPDQYKVNSLTKFLFEKHGGFTTFLDNEAFPDDLAKNRCLALTAIVLNNSGFLNTKNIIELRDCNNIVVYTSSEGKSKNKTYEKAFHEAIRKAFQSIKALNYKYNGKNNTLVTNIPTQTPNPPKPNKPVVINNPDTKPNKPINTNFSVLYAQEIKNGFQLVNTKPEVVLQVLKSSKKDFYFIKNKNGVLFKKGENWIAEFYENDKLVQKLYQIKF